MIRLYPLCNNSKNTTNFQGAYTKIRPERYDLKT